MNCHLLVYEILIFSLQIRKQAIKDLSAICKDNREQVLKIADILAQLLQAEDLSELVTVQESLVALLKFDAKGIFHFFKYFFICF